MATPADYIKIELKEANPTSVVLTGTRADTSSSSTATLTLTPTEGTAVTETIAMDSGESEKDYIISGLTPETAYTITGTGQYDSGGSISSVTTIEDSPKTATISQWEDLANRVKNAGGLSTTTTFWGQTASGGVVSGNIVLGGASTDHPKTVGLNDNGAKIDFGYDSPDNGYDYVRIKATNTTTNKSATLEVMAENDAYISSDAPLYMGSKQIKNLADGTANTDAVTKGQMEDRILAGGTSVPTTATVGKVGTLYAYVESGTGHLAICTDVTGGTYTWQTLI